MDNHRMTKSISEALLNRRQDRLTTKPRRNAARFLLATSEAKSRKDLSYTAIKKMFDKPRASKDSYKKIIGDLTIDNPDDMLDVTINNNFRTNESLDRAVSKLKPALATPYISNRTIEIENQASPL